MGKVVVKQATPDDAVLRAVVEAWESLAARFEVPPSQSIKLWQNENRVTEDADK